MNLTEQDINHLKDVTDFIIEFEEDDYEDWVRDTGNAEGHVYWKAKQLAYALHRAGVMFYRTNNS